MLKFQWNCNNFQIFFVHDHEDVNLELVILDHTTAAFHTKSIWAYFNLQSQTLWNGLLTKKSTCQTCFCYSFQTWYKKSNKNTKQNSEYTIVRSFHSLAVNRIYETLVGRRHTSAEKLNTRTLLHMVSRLWIFFYLKETA